MIFSQTNEDQEDLFRILPNIVMLTKNLLFLSVGSAFACIKIYQVLQIGNCSNVFWYIELVRDSRFRKFCCRNLFGGWVLSSVELWNGLEFNEIRSFICRLNMVKYDLDSYSCSCCRSLLLKQNSRYIWVKCVTCCE